MDAKITGEFIAQLRKGKNLTQKQLAQEISVTDKAVSRWETGKGYPDVTSLLRISEIFDVSVNELLKGARINTDEIKSVTEENVVSVMSRSAKVKENNKRLIIALVSVLAVILLIAILIISLFGVFSFKDYSDMLYGNPNCIIADDYSSVEFYGKRYVPLKLGELICEDGKKLVDEARVKGTSRLDKMFFGDMFYSVNGCRSNELIHLYTDYDYPPSEIYCVEEKLDYYQESVKNAKPEKYFFEVQYREYYYKIECDFDFSGILESSKGENLLNSEVRYYSAGNGDKYIGLYGQDSSGIFYFDYGWVVRQNNKYYYFEDPYSPADTKAFLIDQVYYNDLNLMFSYLSEQR